MPANAANPTRRIVSLRGKLLFKLPLAITGLAALSLGALLIYYTIIFPDPLSLRHKERAPVVRILARDGAVLAERGAAHDYMPLDLLPAHVINAVVATEDRRFYDHWGVDPWGLTRAAFANLRAGRFAQGGSTLTQQLAKNLFLSPDRTMARKFEELALAIWLEVRLTKNDILELYLNRVYFGGGAYGIEAAAQRYFDKSARELSIGEAAVIAGLLKAPSKYSPAASPSAARARGLSVVAKMEDAGVIAPSDAEKARGEHIAFSIAKTANDQKGFDYAVDFVLDRLPPLVGTGHAEVVVETTLDSDLQRHANKVVEAMLQKHATSLKASQAAVVVLDNDGGIRAMVGGRSYADSQFNRAVKARRQPGSAFKPFVYLAALESGLSPDSIIEDVPLSVDGWAPRNENGQHVGAITMREALAKSVNTVAVRLAMNVGPERVAHMAHLLGIRSQLREEPSLALGTSEISLLELTGAYGVFANGGAAIEPHVIRRVRISSGRVLYARTQPRTVELITPTQVSAMNDMLNAAMVSGTGRRAGLPNHPAAGKTGTSQDFRDAWFVGYTAHLTAGVWLGNDNGATMNRVMGGSIPAEIWREIMVTAHDGKAPLALPGTHRVGHSTMPMAGNRMPQEVLPWSAVPAGPISPDQQNRGAAAVKSKPLPKPLAATAPVRATGIPRNATPERHPTSSIDADFIANALAEAGADSEPATDADDTVELDEDVAENRFRFIPAAPPAGMMALGRGLGN